MSSTFSDRIDGIASSVAIKAPCRVATTAPITLYGLQTIDGVAVAANDRVLVRAQSNSADNGIWVASATAWVRAKDFDGNRDAVTGTLVSVRSGSDAVSTVFYRLTSPEPITIGTTAITFERILLSAEGSALAPLLSSTNKGNTRAASVQPGGHWIEDDNPSSSVWSERIYDGTDDIEFIQIDTANNRVIPRFNTFTSAAQTGNFSVSADDMNRTFYCDASGGSITATLPNLSTVRAGFGVGFRKTNAANSLTVQRAGSGEKIFWPTNDGAGYNSVLLPTRGDTIWIETDGTNWFITSDGVQGPFFSVNRGGTAQTSISSATPTKVLFGNEVSDSHAAYDNVTNYRWIPPVPGRYLVVLGTAWSAAEDNTLALSAIRKTGATVAAVQAAFAGTAIQQTPGLVSDVIDMNGTTDFLEAWVTHNMTGAQSLNGDSVLTFFRGIRLK